MLLSLFCGCGGLDLGFEQAGFSTSLAFDLRKDAVKSWSENLVTEGKAYVRDVSKLSLSELDTLHGARFAPSGVIGGPPCQSFSRANHFRSDDDPRSDLVRSFIDLALRLNRHRDPLKFIVLENVLELERARDGKLLDGQEKRLKKAGFKVFRLRLNAVNYSVPQKRKRLFVVAIREGLLSNTTFHAPARHAKPKTVRDAISGLGTPVFFKDWTAEIPMPIHPNHWCMTPQSKKFFNGSLQEGKSGTRSFKTLAWDAPSITVSYGHREVHVHPNCDRRLSIYEALLLQGFPRNFWLHGTLSSQIDQVSEAVPPPLAAAVANSVRKVTEEPCRVIQKKPAKNSPTAGQAHATQQRNTPLPEATA